MDLDTLFIDEGFGSLDTATLDQVMAVIDELRDRGRVVGIVSHVADLKDRVSERLEVRRLPARLVDRPGRRLTWLRPPGPPVALVRLGPTGPGRDPSVRTGDSEVLQLAGALDQSYSVGSCCLPGSGPAPTARPRPGWPRNRL